MNRCCHTMHNNTAQRYYIVNKSSPLTTVYIKTVIHLYPKKFLPIKSLHLCNRMQCIMINHQAEKTQRKQWHIQKVEKIILRLCEYKRYFFIAYNDSFDIIFLCSITKIVSIRLFYCQVHKPLTKIQDFGLYRVYLDFRLQQIEDIISQISKRYLDK